MNFPAQTISAPVRITLITLLLLCLGLGCGKEADVGESAGCAPVTLKTEPKVEVKKPLTKEESAKVIETVIRKAAKKPVGELTKSDLKKVTRLERTNLDWKKITDLKELAKLKNLTFLQLDSTQITDEDAAELQKALPKCKIYHSYKRD